MSCELSIARSSFSPSWCWLGCSWDSATASCAKWSTRQKSSRRSAPTAMIARAQHQDRPPEINGRVCDTIQHLVRTEPGIRFAINLRIAEQRILECFGDSVLSAQHAPVFEREGAERLVECVSAQGFRRLDLRLLHSAPGSRRLRQARRTHFTDSVAPRASASGRPDPFCARLPAC